MFFAFEPVFANGAVTASFGYLFNDLMHITGGMKEGRNPFGHSALAVEGEGVFSYGNSTPLGSSPLTYIESQSLERDQVVTIVPTSAEQDASVLRYFRSEPEMNGVGIIDNCAVRVCEAYGAAGIHLPNAMPFPGSVARGAMTLPGQQSFYIPKGGAIPKALLDAIPRFNPTSAR